MSVYFKRRGDAPERFAVTNSLTHVTTSNPASSVIKGKPYTATLTMESGYTTLSVTVTMGGVDVTASVYSNGTISISAVTGDIVITAVATKGVPVVIIGSGNFNYCYVTINGTRYYEAASMTVSDGNIVATVSGSWMMHGYVYLNGSKVLDYAGTGSNSYTLPVTGKNSISISLGNETYGWTIRITTT